MIVAGIDEAGYGPLLGPLVVGCTAFELPADPACQEPPCLWARLSNCVSRSRSKTGRKLHVNDSKVVYSSSAGLTELEKSVVALVTATQAWPPGLSHLLQLVAPEVMEPMEHYPWYQPQPDERFPLAQGETSIRLIANALKVEMQRTQTRCVHVAAKVFCERELNRMFNATRNKGASLFSIAAMHLDHLLRNFGSQNLFIVCDRHGGRAHYGHLLRLMFEEWALEIISEEESISRYQLSRGGQVVHITFREKAETNCLPVAYASMLSKYIREAMMHRFNNYWKSLAPGINPTAGYYTDGLRFLQEIAPARKELGIPDELLIRSR